MGKAAVPIEAGAAVLPWIWEPSDHVRRRVESVAFLDGRSIRRHVSVDFELPVGGVLLDDRWVHPIPLAFFERGPVLLDFDLTDESGAAIPAVFGGASNELTTSVVAAAARDVLGRPASPYLVHLLWPERAVAAAVPVWLRSEWDVLAGNAAFRWLVELLEGKYPLYAVLPASDPRGHRVLKYSHTVRYFPSRPDVRETLGWRPTSLTFDLPSLGDSLSYHFEFEAPEGLAVARLRVEVPATGEELTIPAEGRRLAHAHIFEEGVGVSGRIKVEVQPVRRGLVTTAALSTLLTAALLTFAAVFTAQVRASSSATSLLLAIATLVSAASSARPGEHGLTSYFLRGARRIAGLTGLLAFAAAGLTLLIDPVTAGMPSMAVRPAWIRPTLAGLAVAAWLAGLTLLVTFVRAGMAPGAEAATGAGARPS